MFKSLLDPDFKYRNSASTDIRKTFERVRREQRLGKPDVEGTAKVVARIGGGKRIPPRSAA